MARPSLLEAARVARGLTQDAVARRSGTSQPTLSAYERGTRSPTLAVTERILHALGFDLGLQPHVTFQEVLGNHGQTHLVPDQLWRVDPPGCFSPLIAREPDGTRRRFNPVERADRVDAYVWLLRHGDEEQLFTHIDAALLVDVWPDVSPQLSEELSRQWAPLVESATLGWAEELLIASLREGRPPPISPKARARAIKRLAEQGLTADEIRAVLHRR